MRGNEWGLAIQVILRTVVAVILVGYKLLKYFLIHNPLEF